MMYYNHQFYRLLVRSYRVGFYADALVVANREGEEERRVPYSEMTKEELAACCRYIGRLSEQLRNSL